MYSPSFSRAASTKKLSTSAGDRLGDEVGAIPLLREELQGLKESLGELHVDTIGAALLLARMLQ